MSEQLDASVLIVGYKSADLIGPCLQGLYAHTEGLSFEVLYADNSDDGSAAWVTEHYPQTRVLDPGGNLGFAGGNNFLAKHAAGRWIVLLNPDTLVEHNAIGALIGFGDDKPAAGAVGGLTVHRDNSLENSCTQPGPSLKSAWMNAFGLGRYCRAMTQEPSEPIRVRVLSGAFMAMRRELWQELGGFDESFFMYNDEVELCLRVAEHGRELWLTPTARVVHLVGSGDPLRPARLLAMTRSVMHLTRRRLPKAHRPITAASILVHCAVRYLGSWPATPIIGPDRARRLREAFGPLLFHPTTWWYGYDEPTTQRESTNTNVERSTA